MKKHSTWLGFMALAFFSFSGLTLFAQPANDNLCNATSLTLGAGCSGTSNGDNTLATLQTGEAEGTCWGGSGSTTTVWYSFVAPASGNVSITTDDANGGFAGTNDDTNIALYELPTGSTCATPSALVELECNEDISFGNFLSTIPSVLVTPGQTYYVQVSGYSNTTGTFCIRVDALSPPSPPANDSICNAIALVVGAGCSGGPNGDNIDATLEAGEAVGSCYDGSETATVWYTFLAPASGVVTITTEPGFAGTNNDTELSLWTLAPFATCQQADSLTELACNDDTPTTPGNLSTLDSIVVVPGNTYYVQVTGYQNLEGTFCVRVEDYAPPARPANDSLCNATLLTVNAGCSASNGDNTNATLESGEDMGACYLNSTTVTVWYAFVAPPSGVVGITTDGGFTGSNDDTQISLWSLPSTSNCTDIDSLVELACSEDINSNTNFLSAIPSAVLTPGQTYYIQVSGYANTEGTFCIQVDSLSSVINDDVCAAITLPADGAARTYSNAGATLQTGEASLEQPVASGPTDPAGWVEPTINHSVWFTFVAPASGVVEVDLCGPGNTNFDTQVALYQATNCADFSTFTFVAANDDLENQCSTFAPGTTGNWASTVTTCVVPGQTYYVLVDGFNSGTGGEQGTFGISITEITGATTPLDATSSTLPPLCPTDANGSVSLLVSGGYAPYSILWNNGATTANLVNLTAGTYLYSVTDGCDSTLSGSVVLAANRLGVTLVVDSPACANAPIQLGTDITGGKKILSKSLFGVDLGTGRVMKMALNDPTGASPAGNTPVTGAFFGGDFAFGVLFAINNTNNAFVAIDPGTGLSSTVGTSTKLTGHTWTGLAFDEASSTMFGLSTNGTATQLYTVNFSNGAATPLTAITASGGTFVPIWLAIDNNSQMFALNIVDDNLYKINPSLGTATAVGSIGFSTGFAQDADFDPTTNELYAGIYDTDNDETQLRRINTTTGTSSFIGIMGNNISEMDAVAIQAETQEPYAYSWTPATGLNNNGISNPVATISANTQYIVSVVDACGSIASDTATVVISPQMILSISSTAPTSGNNGSATASVFSGGTAPFTYLWSNGTTTATNTGLSAIKYTVTVTDAAGCSVTDSVNVAVTSLEELRSAGISNVRLYPNPSEGRFNLEVALDRTENLVIRVYDVNGRLVTERRPGQISTFNQEIDLGAVASGMYQLTLSTSRGAASLRFFVR